MKRSFASHSFSFERRSRFILLCALLPAIMRAGLALGGVECPAPELLTFGAGSEEAVLLRPEESAGQFFTAQADFIEIAVEVKTETGWQAQANFALYGPFDAEERPADYAARKIFEQTVPLNRGRERVWHRFRFAPQTAGNYFWSIRNPRINTQLALFARSSGIAGAGFAYVKDRPVYWQDLKSAIGGALRKDPLPLPAAAPPAKGKSAPADTTPAGQFGAHVFPDAGNLDLLRAELPLLAQSGIGRLTLQLQSPAQFDTLRELAVAAAGSGRGLALQLAMKNWSLAGVRQFLDENSASDFQAQPLLTAQLGNLCDPEFRKQSRAAWEKICTWAAQLNGAGMKFGACEITVAPRIPLAAAGAAGNPFAEYLRDLFDDETPGRDTNGDGRTFHASFEQSVPDWPDAAVWVMQQQENPFADALVRRWSADELRGWLKELCAASKTLPLQLASSELNLLSAVAAEVSGLTLLDPDERELDIFTRLYTPQPFELAAGELCANYEGPDLYEKIRNLVCRQLDRPLEWQLGNWNTSAADSALSRSQAGFALVSRQASARTISAAAGLHREMQAAQELPPLLQTARRQNPSVLVVANDLNRAPFLAQANYLHESALADLALGEMKKFRAILLCAPGRGALGGALPPQLERYVKSGGTVLFAPEQFVRNALFPLILPAEQRELLTRQPEPIATEGAVFYHDEYDNDRKWHSDVDQYSNYVNSVFKTQNGMLGVGPAGGKADLFYKFKLPLTAQFLEVRVKYRAWGGQDWAQLFWGAKPEEQIDAQLPIERGKTLEWKHVFDIREELPGDSIYLHVLLLAGDPARGKDDVQGAAIEDLQLILHDDPQAFAREFELDGTTFAARENGGYFLGAEKKSLTPAGQVTSRGGVRYPLAWESRNWRGGGWVYCNVPELFTNDRMRDSGLLERLIGRYVKNFPPPEREPRMIYGDNFLAVSKAAGTGDLRDAQLTFPARTAHSAVFDWFARRLVEHRQQGGQIVFRTSLEGPDAAKVFVIKPAENPVLLVADGGCYAPSSIDSGSFRDRTLTFSCSRRAYVYSAQPPQSVSSNGGSREFRYDAASGLLTVDGTGQLEQYRIQF